MTILNAAQVVELQDKATHDWHLADSEAMPDGVYGLIAANHRQNYLLWHEEDKARRDDMGPAYVYDAKRAIDSLNQSRNNYIEKIDQHICGLIGDMSESIPMHTETPGMIIDRLSILSLKKFHMLEETLREDVDAEHIKKCQHKLSVLTKQRDDLKQGLTELMDLVLSGKKGFRVYFQFKMYNDPTLNPELYKKS